MTVQRCFISSSTHYFLFHHPSEHSLHALFVMLGKNPKVPRLCFLILQSENIGSCPKEAFNTETFIGGRGGGEGRRKGKGGGEREKYHQKNPKQKTNHQKNPRDFSWTSQDHYSDFTILFGTWAYKTRVTFPNNVRKILSSWTRAAILFTCRLLGAIKWQFWSLGLILSAKSTNYVSEANQSRYIWFSGSLDGSF